MFTNYKNNTFTKKTFYSFNHRAVFAFHSDPERILFFLKMLVIALEKLTKKKVLSACFLSISTGCVSLLDPTDRRPR